MQLLDIAEPVHVIASADWRSILEKFGSKGARVETIEYVGGGWREYCRLAGAALLGDDSPSSLDAVIDYGISAAEVGPIVLACLGVEQFVCEVGADILQFNYYWEAAARSKTPAYPMYLIWGLSLSEIETGEL